MFKACWLWFVILKKYVELTRLNIKSCDPIFFTGTWARSRVSGNDRLFLHGLEFGPNPEISASPVIQLQPRPAKAPLPASPRETGSLGRLRAACLSRWLQALASSRSRSAACETFETILWVAPPRKTRPPDHTRVNWPVDASASGSAQVGATDEPREFRLAGSRQDKRLERAIPLTTHLWYDLIYSIGKLKCRNDIRN